MMNVLFIILKVGGAAIFLYLCLFTCIYYVDFIRKAKLPVIFLAIILVTCYYASQINTSIKNVPSNTPSKPALDKQEIVEMYSLQA